MFFNTLSITLKQVRNIVDNKRLTKAGICNVDIRSKDHIYIKVDDKDKQITHKYLSLENRHNS